MFLEVLKNPFLFLVFWVSPLYLNNPGLGHLLLASHFLTPRQWGLGLLSFHLWAGRVDRSAAIQCGRQGAGATSSHSTAWPRVAWLPSRGRRQKRLSGEVSPCVVTRCPWSLCLKLTQNQWFKGGEARRKRDDWITSKRSLPPDNQTWHFQLLLTGLRIN